LLTVLEHLSSHPIFSGVRVSRSLVFCVMFCISLFVLLSFFFCHCVVCPSSSYRFVLSLWYLQTLLITLLLVSPPSVQFCQWQISFDMNGNSLKEHILLNEMKLEKLYCRPHQIITDILDSSILTVCMLCLLVLGDFSCTCFLTSNKSITNVSKIFEITFVHQVNQYNCLTK
jgi:hypothetical protein